jgi:hypothetical protein
MHIGVAARTQLAGATLELDGAEAQLMTAGARSWVIAASLGLAVACTAVVMSLSGPADGGAIPGQGQSDSGQGTSGAGFDYRGEFYALSSAEVPRSRLGPPLDSGIPFQDTTVDVRAIDGIDPAVTLAALVDVPVAAGVPARTWFVLSPQPELAADPWSQPELAAVLGPAE